VEKKAAPSYLIPVPGKKIYVHKAPDFTVMYPESYKQQFLESSVQVLKLQRPNSRFIIDVFNTPRGSKLEDAWKAYVDVLKTKNTSTNVKLVYSELTKLKDGSPALLYAVEWTRGHSTHINTLALTVFKDKKSITMHSYSLTFG